MRAAGTRLGAAETVGSAVGACAALVAFLLTDVVGLARRARHRIDGRRLIVIINWLGRVIYRLIDIWLLVVIWLVIVYWLVVIRFVIIWWLIDV